GVPEAPAVDVRVGLAARVKRLHPVVRHRFEIIDRAERERRGGAGLRAGRAHADLEPVLAEDALVHPAGPVVERDDPERARADAVAAADAHVLVDVDGTELRAVQRAGGADLEASGLYAVLAGVAHHQPARIRPVARARVG